MSQDEYEQLGASIGRLVGEKDRAYGKAFERGGSILRILYPNGVHPNQYVDMLATIRIVDKLFRLANKKDAFGESPGLDIAGYGLLTHKHHLQQQSSQQIQQDLSRDLADQDKEES